MNNASENNEELLDVFRAAALSVTRLYKTSASAQAKARVDGYQDCLEDLAVLLDKEDTDIRKLRRWVTDRLDGRDPLSHAMESEDEVDKTDASRATPEPLGNSTGASSGAASAAVAATSASGPVDVQMRSDVEMPLSSPPPALLPAPVDSAPAPSTSTPAQPVSVPLSAELAGKLTATETAAATTPGLVDMSVPTQDSFTFRSHVPYPQESSYLALANLDLSDKAASTSSSTGSPRDGSPSRSSIFSPPPPSAASASGTASSNGASYSLSRSNRLRHSSIRPGARASSAGVVRSSGQKRKLNIDEIFDFASLGYYGKEGFGRGNKRNRQA